MATIPRGIRNNNPLNIRRSASKWRGMSAQQSDHAFVQFENIRWGLRAAVLLLANYIAHGYNTPRKIINRWAPYCENDTNAYINYVCSYCNMQPDDVVQFDDKQTITSMIDAMCHVECGKHIDDAYIEVGYDFAAADIARMNHDV